MAAFSERDAGERDANEGSEDEGCDLNDELLHGERLLQIGALPDLGPLRGMKHQQRGERGGVLAVLRVVGG